MGKWPRAKALAEGYKVADTRWIDTDKGDGASPNYHSMLAGKEFNNGQEAGLFVSTPPLEPLSWLVSEAAATDPGGWGGGRVMLVSDAPQAFFEAPRQAEGGCQLAHGGVEHW